jgi:hypothetical protein
MDASQLSFLSQPTQLQMGRGFSRRRPPRGAFLRRTRRPPSRSPKQLVDGDRLPFDVVSSRSGLPTAVWQTIALPESPSGFSCHQWHRSWSPRWTNASTPASCPRASSRRRLPGLIGRRDASQRSSILKWGAARVGARHWSSCHATCAYSSISPPNRSRRMTLPVGTKTARSPGPGAMPAPTRGAA